MELLANFLLAVGAIGAGLYCLVLSRKMRRFNSLEDGMGGAIAVLSVQVDDLTKALEQARQTAAESEAGLKAATARAEAAVAQLETGLTHLPTDSPPHGARRTARVQRRRQVTQPDSEEQRYV